jgi:hypothetical protein
MFIKMIKVVSLVVVVTMLSGCNERDLWYEFSTYRFLKVTNAETRTILHRALMCPQTTSSEVDAILDKVVVEEYYFIPTKSSTWVREDREANMARYGFKRAIRYQGGVHIYWFYTHDNIDQLEWNESFKRTTMQRRGTEL